jgi:hypothetical protein
MNNPEAIRKNNHITPEEIYSKYSKNGFSNFKLEGRTWAHIDLAIAYANYLALPEYKLYVISILTSLYKEK